SAMTLGDNRVSGDVLTDAYGSADFADKNVGTGKTVTTSGITVTGTDAGNYSYNATATSLADITQAQLTITASGGTKVYDGKTTASAMTLGDNRVSGDVLTDAYGSADFADKNVGTGKIVITSGITVTGTDAGNYSYNASATSPADITQTQLTITASGGTKVYDGKTAASAMTLGDNRISGDALTEAYASADFSDKNTGTGKTVNTTGITITGADAANYSYNTSATSLADITQAQLTITASGGTKVYDGKTAASAMTLGDNRVSGDVLTDAYGSADFADKNVATGKTVTTGGITVTGTDAANYSYNATATSLADITQAQLTVTASGGTKVYDGKTTASAMTLGDNRVSGDVLTDAYGSADFADKNVATGKTVTTSGITVTGTDAGNYSYNATATSLADITQAQLTITASGGTKVYDGKTTASAMTLGDNRVSGDVLTDAYTAADFADKNVGTGKTVTTSGITVTGTDAGNYSYNATTTSLADITQAQLTITASGGTKVYDGKTAASAMTLGDNRVSGDVLTDAYTAAAFADKNVATGKTVTTSGITVTGTDAANYSYNATATSLADITQAQLTITASGGGKVYDGNTIASITLGDNRVSGDAFNDTYTAADFSDKNAGTGKTITTTGISINGTDAGNYTFNITTTSKADITQAQLTVTANAQSKIYGATLTETTGSTAFTSSPLIGAETIGNVTIDYGSGSSAADPAGTYTGAVSPSTATGGSFDANNYSINYVPGTLTVTKAVLTITADPESRYYGYNNPSPITASYNGFKNSDGPASLTTQPIVTTIADINSIPGTYQITVSGATSNNYTFIYVPGIFTVNAVPIVFSAIAPQVYGTPNFDPGATSIATITYSSSNPLVATIVSGKIHIVATGTTTITANNKSGTQTTNVLTVTPAPLTITATGPSKIYGTALTAGTSTANFTASAGVNGQVVTGITLTPNAAGLSATAAAGTTYTVTPSLATGTNGFLESNYNVTYAPFTGTVTKAALTVTATGPSKIYGTALTAGTSTTNFTATAALNSQVVTGLTLTPNVAGLSVTTAAGTTYTVTPSLATGTNGFLESNYSMTYVPFTGTVTKAALTVTATGPSKIYGTALPAGTSTTNFTASAGANGQVVTGVTLTPNAAGLSATTAAGTTYTVTPSLATGTNGFLESNYSVTYNAFTGTVGKAALIVTATGPSKIYGTALTAGVSTTNFTASAGVNGQVVTSITLTPNAAGLSAITAAGSTYTVTPSLATGTNGFLESNYSVIYNAFTGTVATYPTCTSYNGVMFANTDVGSNITASNVLLSVAVNTPYDNTSGTSATVKFYINGSNTPVTAAFVSYSAAAAQSVYSYTIPTVTISPGGAVSMTIPVNWTVSGNYSVNTSCPETSTMLTISTRSSDFVTGGGFVITTASSGKYAGDPNTKANFGFNIKWNKTLSNIQGGGFNAMVRGTDPITKAKVLYQIKGTKVLTLMVNTTNIPYIAAFTANAVLTEYDITGTTMLNSFGNCSLTVALTDACEPGSGNNASGDLIGITLNDSYGKLLYSNNWVSGNTVQQVLNGGNLQVHGDLNTPAPTCVSLNSTASLANEVTNTAVVNNNILLKNAVNPLSVVVYPNPSISTFNLQSDGGSNEMLEIRVSDILGNMIEQYKIMPGATITIGDKIPRPGIYLVQVKQGQTYKFYKVFKQ
ncbi:MAG: Fibronectin type domain protein, partial [Mucilaginibacter sp.]|nr:Fibronectin type domain protein [Mucilaginibacter sp.]